MINQTRIEVSHLSNLCDFNDTNILVRGNITVAAGPITHVAFKNCSPFTKSMTKIDGTTAGNTEEVDMVIPMYNLIEYSLNFSDLTGSLRFYCKDEETNFGMIMLTMIILSLSSIRLNCQEILLLSFFQIMSVEI